MIDWLPTILKSIGDAKVADVLREKVGLLELQRDQAIAERDVLATKLAQAKAQIELLQLDKSNLQAQVDDSQRQAQDELVPYKGALWKRKPGGGYFDDVLCRECHNPMISFCNIHPFHCDSCNVMVNFNGGELLRVMRGLP